MRNQKRSQSSLLLATVSAAAVSALQGLPSAAVAAETTAAPIEEILVTSRRRSETLQDVPMAVNAFNAATIERAGIDRAENFIALTPNVHFIQTTNIGESQVHIRGVIQPRDTEPPFAYVLDGVLVPNPNAFNQEFVDIQQIEIIKGPIGSIYGRNAIGGAILVTTKKPSNTFEGMLKGGYEVEGEEYKLSGYVSGPVVEDKVFARITGSYTDRQGYYKNITLNDEEDPFQEAIVRGRVVIAASESVEFDITAGYADVDGHAFNFNNQTGGTPGFETGVDINDTSIPFSGNVRSFNNQKRYDATIKMDWTSDYGTLTMTGAYHKLDENMGGEGAVDLALFGLYPDPTPGDFFTDPSLFEGYGPTPRDGTQYQERNQKDTSFEIRFTSPDDRALRYIVGAYYIDFSREVVLNRAVDTGNGVVVPEPAPGPDSENPAVAVTWTDNDNKAYSLFGQLAYDVTEQLEASVAVRWDKEKRETTNLTPPEFTNNPSDSGLVRKSDFSDFQPRVSLRYLPNDDVSLYATYGEGFRSGGFNPLGSRDNIINIDGITDTTVQDAFDKETSKSAEIGFKSSLMDRKLSVNGAAFYTEVNNAHYFQFFPFSLSRVISIVDKNEIWGFEFDFTARLDEGWTFYGGFGYIDSEIKRNNEAPQTVGNTMPFTPEYTANVGMQYVYPLGNGMDMVTRVDYFRTGPIYFDTLNTPGTKRKPIDLVDARIGLDAENWSFTLWARNLFDENYNADGVVLVVPNVTVFNFVTKATPRTWGADITFRF